MLKDMGVESYYVLPADALPTVHFDHAILAIQLPADVKSTSFPALSKYPVLGNILYFDPTNEFIPFGQLPGYLQGNYAVLVHQGGSELTKLPVQSPSTSGVIRTAKLNLDDKGTSSGEVISRSVGYIASENRRALQKITSDAEKTKFLERGLANAFSSFKVVDFQVNNQNDIFQPLEFKYSFAADKYAKLVGDMLIVRPRILGGESSGILETNEKRENPVEFVSLRKDTDDFTVSLPPGYTVDDLPAPVDLDYPFASYHSKTEVKGSALHYTRTFERKQFMVSTDKLDDLKKFYRKIYNDERANAVFVHNTH